MATTAGRLVVITGASSGIGRAAAAAFAERGDRVIAVARSAGGLESMAQASRTRAIVPLVADVTDRASMDAMVRQVLDGHGVPDVIVASAGIGLDALFTATTDEALRAVFEVNVFGLVRSVRPFVSGMVARGSGRILLVSSVVGKRGTPYYSAYSASKFALHGIADALRCELAGSGVSVGLICPGSTSTEFERNLMHAGPGQKRKRLRRLPAEAVAAAIVRMADSRRLELVLPLEARLLCLVDAVAPRLVDRFLARMLAGGAEH